MHWWKTYFDETYLDLCRQLGVHEKEQAREQAQAAVRMLGIAPPARLLDLCCGEGRHAIPLARMGFAVSGLDISGDSLERARRHAAETGVEVEFRQGDMREIAGKGTFDGCVMMGSSFGVLESETEKGN
jgi:D-alanine-D-alanine ligase